MNTPRRKSALPGENKNMILQALNHPARVGILRVLRDGEHCVCHLEAYLGYRQAYISQQLSVLREAGLIEDRKDGWNVFYRVTKPEIFAVLDMVEQISGESVIVQTDDQVDCPCPHCARTIPAIPMEEKINQE